jgi:hypothetical protein
MTVTKLVYSMTLGLSQDEYSKSVWNDIFRLLQFTSETTRNETEM